VGGLLCSLYLTSKWIIQSEEEVVVPNLVGHDTVYGLDLLTSLGLNIKVGGFMWSDSVPKNFIAVQDPASGTRLKRDRDVKVFLSRGSRSVRVPKLVDNSLREAELILSQNGLQLGGLSRVPSSRYSKDRVIAQRPTPLQELERGQAVDLLISGGPKPAAIAMPELRQQPLGKALKILSDLGLVAAAVKEIHQPGQPLDTIMSQRPLAGYRVDGVSSIILTVNRTPEQTKRQGKLWWVTYQVPEGYFKKEIALSRHFDGKQVLLYKRIHRPGDRIEWLVWARSLEEVNILVDGMLQRQESSGFQWERLGGVDHLPGDTLARIIHESAAPTVDMTVLPGVLGPLTLRRTVQVRLGVSLS
jgi:serine/threonine-protein kinase